MRLLALRTILVASDLTRTSDAALRTAVDLTRGSGASLHGVHVAIGEPLVAESGRRAEYRSELASAFHRAGADDGTFTLHVSTGDVAAAIGEVADRIDADVVILGSQGRGALAQDRPLGGTAYSVITRSRIPCLAVTEPLRLPIRNALVAIDRSEAARGALLVALSWVSAIRSRNGAKDKPTLTVLRVEPGADDVDGAARVDRKTIEHELGVLRRNAEAWAGVTVTSETLEGTEPAKVIASFARRCGCELVVLGTRAHAGADARLGSVSASVTTQVSVPVLLVPPAVWRDHAKDMDYF